VNASNLLWTVSCSGVGRILAGEESPHPVVVCVECGFQGSYAKTHLPVYNMAVNI